MVDAVMRSSAASVVSLSIDLWCSPVVGSVVMTSPILINVESRESKSEK